MKDAQAPFIALGGKVECFRLAEAKVYPLGPDETHPLDSDSASRAAILWRGRWIEAVVLTGDIVEDPPIPADSSSLFSFCKGQELDTPGAEHLFVTFGWPP